MNLLYILFTFVTLVLAIDPDNQSITSTFNAHDVQSFRDDLFTRLHDLQNQLEVLNLDITPVEFCTMHSVTWFPSLPVWLESDIRVTDRLGTLVVRSLDEIDEIIRLLHEYELTLATRSVNLLPFRLQIDGARYRRQIAKQSQYVLQRNHIF